jgi:hypothetical protein
MLTATEMTGLKPRGAPGSSSVTPSSYSEPG